MEVCSIIKKLNLLILISLLLNNKILIESYSQVSRVGAIISSTNNDSSNNTNNSEIIKHNPGREGVFSDNDESNKTLSESNDDELTTIENKPTEVFTGRSSPSTGGFQLPFNFNTKPISYQRPAKSNENSSPASSSPIFVYPSYGSKSIDETYKNSPVQPSAMDRFSPGEAYGFQQQLKKQKNNGYDYTAPKSRLPDKTANAPAAIPPSPPSPPTNLGPPTSPARPVYLPPKDLYSFPPNIGANYLPPTMNGNQRPVTSYLPPAAGIPDDFNSNSFVGPVNPKYLPSSNLQDMPQDIGAQDSGSLDADSTPNDNDNHDHDHDHSHDHDHDHDHSHDHDHDHDHSHDHHHHEHDHDTPPSAPAPVTESPLNQMMAMVVDALKNNNNNNSPPPVASPPSQPTGSDISFSSLDHDHYHHHDHDYPNQFDPSFPTGSDLTFSDHDHFHDHDFHGQYGIDASPELIYDHDPHDHHHDITTTEPPPPPPQEPRVTKYSYYYLGRKLWYVPLYFTVYFTFYVASLIIRSIGRHKVEWPNHYAKRSIDDMSHKETVRKVEKLTNFVMNSMEDFKAKYL